jgi:hypothetical protein
MKGQLAMKKSTFVLSTFYALVFIGLAISCINCMGPGMMYGSIGVNISDQPVWGPTGYDRAEFYYIPDIDCYYSVSEHMYIYWEGREWAHGASLPPRYSGYDPYHSYKVVINEKKPYQNHDSHQVKYGTFKGRKDQPVIRDSHDSRYFINKDHPEHDKRERGQNQ